MKRGKRSFICKVTALFLVQNILIQAFCPAIVYALTAGPSSPEFASFEPVATTDMVNIFSGDFTYNLPVINIPGPQGSGYALSLSYHGGANVEEEASWVGYGWTLNPGAINRNVRGLPDDYHATPVKYYNKTIPNWTVVANDNVALELFSKSDLRLAADKEETPQSSFPSIDLSQTLRYNNYMGFSRSYGVSVGYKGALSLGSEFGASGITFSATVNVVGILKRLQKRAQLRSTEEDKKNEEPAKKSKTKAPKENPSTTQKNAFKHSRHLRAVMNRIKQGVLSNLGASTYGLTAFESYNNAPVVQDYKGFGCNFNTSFQINPSQVPVGIEGGYYGSFRLQYNVPVTEFSAYGYNHNLNKNDFEDDRTVNKINDYYVEKESSFDQRDLFLGIPFPNYDVYLLTGEGLSGSFRSFNLSTGHYYPNFVASDITNVNTGVELMVGTNIGIGLNFGIGNTKFRIKDWGNQGNTGTRQYDKNAGSVFRFTNDLGGKMEYSGNIDVENARLIVNPDFPMIKGAYPEINEEGIYSYLNAATSGDSAARAAGRSSYIKEKRSGSRITGFAITKEDGTCYHYDTAVYARNSVQVSVDVDPAQSEIIGNTLVYRNTPISSSGFDEDLMRLYRTVVGEAKLGEHAKYATSYLLTAITTPDYVDLTGDGPSDDDFGGWTKFDYERIHQDYRWKIPYTGMKYDPNRISDKKDDLGSVSTGEKEVYLLRRIITRTHTAYFVTNKSNAGYESETIRPSYEERMDGISASAVTDNKNARGVHRLEKLEKIVLVSNKRKGTPLKTVNFEYSYDLVREVPNNAESASGGGKLTLNRVWFEYEGIVNARISPYEFYYRYKDKKEYKEGLLQKYPLMEDFFNLSETYPDVAQNPAYSPYSVDAWGFHHPMGKEQAEKLRSWRYQGQLPESYAYDPAAYQLKQIRLPSGGEILVEYEEKDYRFVQDRDVMAMLSIKDFDDDRNGLLGKEKYSKEPWYKLNLEDAGIEASPELVSRMNDYFVTQGNRIYFRFLFQLVSDDIPSLTDCRSEYIDGYVKVDTVMLDGNDIRITLNGDGSSYDGDDRNYPMTPRQACYDFYSTQRVGKYDYPERDCESALDGYTERLENLAYSDDASTLASITEFLKKLDFAVDMMEYVHGQILNKDLQPPIKARVCRQMNLGLSYLKVPIMKAKKGGGCRVKRLVSYDPGIESGEDGVLYGAAYRYEDEDGLSSGVATNEPSGMREENPLVGFLPKKNQTWFSRHTVGRDKEQTEGPIGESLLPGASVGHSRVVIESIHQGISGNGFAIHTFHTVRDFPYDKAYSYEVANSEDGRQYDFTKSLGVDYSELHDNMEKDNAPINAGIFSYNSKKFWASQGFRFIQNTMHGQPISVEKYSGTYTLYKNNRDNVFLAYAQYTDYYKPGEKIRVLKKGAGGEIEVVFDNPGKEMDLVMDMKSVKERTLDFLLEVDLSIGLSPPPPPFITIMPAFEFAENIINLHATSKVISYPVIQRAVRVYQDGVWAETEFMAFDAATGQPLLTRNTDIYDQATPFCSPHDGSIYSLILPAYWYYSEMGQKAEVDFAGGYRTNQINLSAGSVITYGANGNPIRTDSTGKEFFEIPVTGILNAQVQTYAKGSDRPDWFSGSIGIDYGVGGEVLTKLNKVYRPWSQYVYKTAVSSINETPVYNAGIYSSFEPFDFSVQEQAGGWIKINEVVRYSPDGFAVQEKDVLGIPSAVRFGYSHTLPVIAGTNCEYGTIYFQDYENNDQADISYAHSGKRSLRLTSGTTAIVPGIENTDSLKKQGAFIRLWIKTDMQTGRSLRAGISGTEHTVAGDRIASSGEWELYHFEFAPEILQAVSATFIQFDLSYPLINQEIYIDDVRFQPAESEASCFVYDAASMRLITRFDDQHFGLYYQYDSEGKLIRELLETERGIRPLRETTYNTSKKDR